MKYFLILAISLLISSCSLQSCYYKYNIKVRYDSGVVDTLSEKVKANCSYQPNIILYSRNFSEKTQLDVDKKLGRNKIIAFNVVNFEVLKILKHDD